MEAYGDSGLRWMRRGRVWRFWFNQDSKWRRMEIKWISHREAVNARDILADFLKGFVAVAKYGRTVIYEGDAYYLPYQMLTYQVEETGEKYGFLAGMLCEDISFFKLEGKTDIEISSEEVCQAYVLQGEKNEERIREEISRKIKLNKRLRKMFMRFKMRELSFQPVYLREQAFYVKGKSMNLFLVDDFLQKVDFKHLEAVEKRFVENCRLQADAV